MQGVNCEAAVVIEGQFDEPVFQDALKHLERCRDEAVLFDPIDPPPRPQAQETLVLHVETDLTLPSPKWFVHLLPATTDYDKVMRLNARTALQCTQVLLPGMRAAGGFLEEHPVNGYSGWSGQVGSTTISRRFCCKRDSGSGDGCR